MARSPAWQEHQVKPFHYRFFLIVIIFWLHDVGPKVEAEGWMGLHFLKCNPSVSKGSPLGMGAEQPAGWWTPMWGSVPRGENLRDPQI